MNVCFYAAVPTQDLLNTVEFYRQDIVALEGLGHEVRRATRPRDLDRSADLYWVWWPTSGLPAVLWAVLCRRPRVLVSAYSDRDRTASGVTGKSPFAKFAVHLTMALASRVIATSEDTRVGLARYRSRSLRCEPLGVDADFYTPVETGPDEGPYLLTISQLTGDNVQRKRVLDVVRAAEITRRAYPELRFLIAGRLADGAPRVQEAIAADGLEERVLLLGGISVDEKRRLLSGALAYLQPSDYEAFGMAIAEAMSCGAAVISHAVGNVPALVGDTGRLLDPGAGPEALAKEITDLIERGDATELGFRARQRILERFSASRRRERIAATLADVAGGR